MSGSYELHQVARGQIVPVAVVEGMREMRWGMLRPWRGHGGKRGPMIYTARAEETDATPILREARKHQRCAVLADGWLVPGKKPVTIAAGGVIAFAGLWTTNRDDDQPSFAILEGAAPDAVIARLTAVTPLAVDREAWLARGELAAPPGLRWRIGPPGNPAQGELF